jgi:hypothetical protein
MDLRSAIHHFVEQGRELMGRLRSPEGAQLSRVDLHILEVQLYLLAKEVSRSKNDTGIPSPETKQSPGIPPDFPPFDLPEQDTKAKK